jgi:hypothetical protein
LREDRFKPGERVVERVHEQPAHQVDDEQAATALDRLQAPAGARGPRREIGRAQDAVVALDVLDQLALVPDMVTGREDVGAGIVELAGEAFGQPEAMRRILGVDDRDVDTEVVLQRREMALDRLPPRAPDDIAAQKDVHAAMLQPLQIYYTSFRGGAQRRARNLYSRGPCSWIPGSRLRRAPE